MLTGALSNGTKIEKMPLCSFTSEHQRGPGDYGCGELGKYRVTTTEGIVLYACEHHAEELWEEDEQRVQK